MTASQCLGLVLTWHRTKEAEYVLCISFAKTGSVCSLFVLFRRRFILLKALKRDPLAMVRMPTAAEISQFRYSFRRSIRCSEMFVI